MDRLHRSQIGEFEDIKLNPNESCLGTPTHTQRPTPSPSNPHTTQTPFSLLILSLNSHPKTFPTLIHPNYSPPLPSNFYFSQKIFPSFRHHLFAISFQASVTADRYASLRFPTRCFLSRSVGFAVYFSPTKEQVLLFFDSIAPHSALTVAVASSAFWFQRALLRWICIPLIFIPIAPVTILLL
ncbi:hypothetical protein RJT34_33577 [Clitoria ternatea]|uniref:Uncharacterized protein n=1 Tax=Clitoria ternatea TaxID=43366 RepID=A0AAN9F0F4_CLITE